MTSTAVRAHPIEFMVEPELQRTRWKVFFRLVLAIPHLLWLWVFAIAAELAVIVAWVVALVLGRLPGRLHGFLAAFLRYYARLSAWLFLLADPYPPFSARPGGYPVDVAIAPPAHQNRLITLFRIFLILPAVLFIYVFRVINELVAIFGWFVCLITGEMNEGMQNLSAWLMRYELQTFAYLMMITDRYPSLNGLPALQRADLAEVS